jgi:uncharacterized lipoprotein
MKNSLKALILLMFVVALSACASNNSGDGGASARTKAQQAQDELSSATRK